MSKLSFWFWFSFSGMIVLLVGLTFIQDLKPVLIGSIMAAFRVSIDENIYNKDE